MWALIGFIAGLTLGALLGAIIMGLLIIAKEDDF